MTETTIDPATATPPTGIAEVNGTRLWYEVTGPLGAAPPIVLLHAGIADARMWDDQVAPFAERFPVIRYDARGFGRSDPAVGSFSPRADLAALLAALEIERAHLVGISMGGTLAVDLALEEPHLVASLVAAGARPSGLAPSPALRDAWNAVDAVAETGDVAGAVELELRMWVDGPNRTPDRVASVVRERVREMDAALFALPDEGEPLPLDPPALDRLGAIRVPTLVLVGAEDQPDVLAGADRLASGIPGAQKAVIPDTAHVPNMERPAAFNRLVLDFLTGLAQT